MWRMKFFRLKNNLFYLRDRVAQLPLKEKPRNPAWVISLGSFCRIWHPNGIARWDPTNVWTKKTWFFGSSYLVTSKRADYVFVLKNLPSMGGTFLFGWRRLKSLRAVLEHHFSLSMHEEDSSPKSDSTGQTNSQLDILSSGLDLYATTSTHRAGEDNEHVKSNLGQGRNQIYAKKGISTISRRFFRSVWENSSQRSMKLVHLSLQ